MDTQCWQPPDFGADAYVAAGDLFDDGRLSARWCAELAQRSGRPVIFTPGNHDFYGARISVRLQEMARICRAGGVTLLQNRSVVLNGVRFVGGTAWTDFALDGAGFQGLARHAARNMIQDFSAIFVGDGTGAGEMLSPEYTERMHRRTLRALDRGLEDAYEEPVVVVTHHAPSRRSISSSFQKSALNPAFASSLDDKVGWSNARVWVHGHVHHSVDYELGATRVLCNPRGYGKFQNSMFCEGLIVDTNGA